MARPKRIVQTTKGASLIDLGDGALLLEFHSKANSLGDDAMEMMQAAQVAVPKAFAGLVIGNEGRMAYFTPAADPNAEHSPSARDG